MGYNATVVVVVDALDQIEKDPEFGKKLAAAVRNIDLLQMHGLNRADIAAGNHSNAASVVEKHHADQTALVSVGGNMGHVQHTSYGWRHHEKAGQEKLLREWASKLGFDVTPQEPAMTPGDVKTVRRQPRP